MAAFNFPSSPSNGDTYSLNSVTYQYDGTKWVRYSASVGAQGAAGSSATVGNNADNRVITGTGSANTLNGEANLTFDGSALVLDNPNGASYFEIGSDSSNQYSIIDLKGDSTYTDYAFRIMRVNTGANAESQLLHRGTGQFTIKTNEESDIKFYTYGNNERLRIRSDGSTHFYSPAEAWAEGPVVLEASNGYGAIFFRSTGNTHDTSSTGTWSVGKLASTDGFAILKHGMTGGGAVRQDAAINISNAGDTKIGKYLAVGHNTPATRLDVKQNNGVAYDNTVQTVAYNAARFFNESGHTSGGTYTGLQFNLTGDSQNRICSIGMISEASNNRNSSLVFHTDDNGSRNEKLRISSSGHVTKPYNLCLQYTPSGSFNVTSGTVIYATEVFDVGDSNAYNTSNGEFTAPVTGVYRIQYEHFSSGAGRATCAIEKNTGSGYSQVKRGMRVYSVSSGSNWASVPTIFYLQMNATDKFRIVHNEGTVHLNTPWNHMTVQLVQ